MQTGLLWYDDDKAPVQARAIKAAAAYLTKFNRWPTVCHVHADGVAQPTVCELAAGVILRIVPAPYVLRNHFWLGENGAHQ